MGLLVFKSPKKNNLNVHSLSQEFGSHEFEVFAKIRSQGRRQSFIHVREFNMRPDTTIQENPNYNSQQIFVHNTQL